jgi:tRNA pseudouridine55 synthase
MKSLLRTAVGSFLLKDALTLSAVEERLRENRLQEHIITVDQVFQGYSKVNVDREYHKLIYNGNAFKKEHCIDYGMNFTEELIRVYDADDSFIGIYQYDPVEAAFRPVKMFL